MSDVVVVTTGETPEPEAESQAESTELQGAVVAAVAATTAQAAAEDAQEAAAVAVATTESLEPQLTQHELRIRELEAENQSHRERIEELTAASAPMEATAALEDSSPEATEVLVDQTPDEAVEANAAPAGAGKNKWVRRLLLGLE